MRRARLRAGVLRGERWLCVAGVALLLIRSCGGVFCDGGWSVPILTCPRPGSIRARMFWRATSQMGQAHLPKPYGSCVFS